MSREVKCYSGQGISRNVIGKMRYIAKEAERAEGLCCCLNDKCVDTFEELCSLYYAKPSELKVFLGEDWFILYRVGEEELDVSEWHAIDNYENKMIQTAEMITAMKQALLQGDGLTINASMRRGTSYMFYRNLLKVGYLQEYFNYVDVIYPCPGEVHDFYEKIKRKYGVLPDELTSEEKQHPFPYTHHVVHDVEFGVTDKFVKKYGKRLL